MTTTVLAARSARQPAQRTTPSERRASEAGAAGHAVVEEDRRAADLGMGRVGDPADVAAVGDRKQRKQADGGVLDGVDPQLFQFFTYQFLHANWAHIGGNMLFLWIYGDNVERRLGSLGYLFWYLARISPSQEPSGTPRIRAAK